MAEPCGVRPCPFCNSLELKMGAHNGPAVECLRCHAIGPNMSDAEGAWAGWNRGVEFVHPPADTVADRMGGVYKLPRSS